MLLYIQLRRLIVCSTTPNLELGWLSCSGVWTVGLVQQTPDRGGERGGEQLAGNLDTAPAALIWMEPVSCSTLCKLRLRIHCLQPGDQQQHGEWSQARGEESWGEQPATSFLLPVSRRLGAWGQLRGPRALDSGHNKIGNLEAISQILTLFPLLLSSQLRDFANFHCQESTPSRDYQCFTLTLKKLLRHYAKHAFKHSE